MQRLEVSGVVRPLQRSLGVKGLMVVILGTLNIFAKTVKCLIVIMIILIQFFISNSWQHHGHTSSCFYQLLCTHCHFLSLLLHYKQCLPEMY